MKLENSPNSYIVPIGGDVEIPCGKPYLVAEKRTDVASVNLTDKVTLDVLWQDTPGLIKTVGLTTENQGPYSKFKVETNNVSGGGNALVAVRMGPNGDETDPIAWSWHIWVTDYDPDASGTTYTTNNGNKDYAFMDRHLGATSVSDGDPIVIGLTYQWGRKDPFSKTEFSPDESFYSLYSYRDNVPLTELDQVFDPAGGDGTGIIHRLAVDNSTAVNNLTRSIQNPMTFLYGADDAVDSDWLSNKENAATGDDSLWGSGDTKSDFDPCPCGWKVPSYSDQKSPWENFLHVDYEWNPSVEVTATTYALNLVGSVGEFSALGLYPLSNYRRPSKHLFGGGFVGSKEEYMTGGSFGNGVMGASDREFLVWSTGNSSGSKTAKGLYSTSSDVVIGPSGPQAPGSIEYMGVRMLDKSRSAGAFVRCVKEIK